MQLDRTQITIRPRSGWEILDLALRICWLQHRPLLLYTAITAVPLYFFNMFVLRWALADEYSYDTISYYLWLMGLLVFLEAPLVTLAPTDMLGRWMFSQDTSWPAIRADLWAVSGRLFWCFGIVRGGLAAFGLALSLEPSLDPSGIDFLLVVLALYSALVRSARPFLPEIILLERSWLRKRTPQTITIGRRNSALHGPSTGDMIGRWMLMSGAASLLAISLIISAWYCVAMLTNDWQWNAIMVQVVVPVSFWLMVMYTTVVRYLYYLDLRIRREGWEVELRVRAAAQELRGQLA
ncbi:MAG: hypothetical protein KDA92_09740 [Planctomycetales bacterium]|nr:hypothetical protein [Planctomycetales bacterium]